MSCHKCGEAVAKDSIYCRKCGAVQKVFCSKCGSAMNADAEYCAACGNSSTTRLARNEMESTTVQRELAGISLRCPRCRKVNEPGAAYCFSCGLPFDDHIKSDMATEDGMIGIRAGFWVRLCAMMIDLIVIGILNGIVYGLTQSEFVATIINMLYWTLGVSQYEGTLGKRVLGLRVLRTDLSRCGFWQAFARQLCYALSFLLLCIGFFMVGLRNDKRGLHDLICGTVVIKG